MRHALLQQQPVRRGQGAGFDIGGVRRGHIVVGHEAGQGLRRQGQLQGRDAGKRVQLGSEDEKVAGLRIEEGLLAEAIPGAEKPAAPGIPEGEGKHAVEPGKTVSVPAFIGGQQHLGIGGCAEAEAFLLHDRAKFPVIVDFTVEGERMAAVAHGLRAAGQVDDGETTMPQADRSVEADALTVRAAPGHAVEHGAHVGCRFFRQMRLTAGMTQNKAGYTAHEESLPP